MAHRTMHRGPRRCALGKRRPGRLPAPPWQRAARPRFGRLHIPLRTFGTGAAATCLTTVVRAGDHRTTPPSDGPPASSPHTERHVFVGYFRMGNSREHPGHASTVREAWSRQMRSVSLSAGGSHRRAFPGGYRRRQIADYVRARDRCRCSRSGAEPAVGAGGDHQHAEPGTQRRQPFLSTGDGPTGAPGTVSRPASVGRHSRPAMSQRTWRSSRDPQADPGVEAPCSSRTGAARSARHHRRQQDAPVAERSRPAMSQRTWRSSRDPQADPGVEAPCSSRTGVAGPSGCPSPLSPGRCLGIIRSAPGRQHRPPERARRTPPSQPAKSVPNDGYRVTRPDRDFQNPGDSA